MVLGQEPNNDLSSIMLTHCKIRQQIAWMQGLLCVCGPLRPVKALHSHAFSSLFFKNPHLCCFWVPGSGFKLIVHQVVVLRGAEVDKVCSQWNIFEKRQPVTMDLLCAYPEVTSTLSRCVYYCWSLLESIWVLGFGPFWSVPRTILLPPAAWLFCWHRFTSSFSYLVLASHPDQLRNTVTKKKKRKNNLKPRKW